VFISLLGLLVFPSLRSAAVTALALAAVSLIGASAERWLGLRRPAWVYPPLELALGILRGVLWFVPLVSRTVMWRGNALALTSRTRIEVKSRGDAAAVPVPLR